MSRNPDAKVKVFAVWEPILANDARSPQPEPKCCTRDGILWDLVAVYPPDAAWTEAMPPAVLFNGAVVHLEADIEAAVRKLQK